jgi:flavin-binding protein dodecin
MWVSKHNEFIGSSSESFEEAAQQVVARANRTLRGLTGIEVVGKRLKVVADGPLEYRVQVRLLMDVAAPEGVLHW